jgi:Na+/H+ antiporter NhaD/arsenite permease-like protein
MTTSIRKTILAFLAALMPLTLIAAAAQAATAEAIVPMDLTRHPAAVFCVVVFILSYIAVLLEERTHLRKSKPVMLGAGIIWVTIGIICRDTHIDHETLQLAVYHGLEEYGSLLLFLLAAMTFISALQDRQVFDALRAKLINAGFGYRALFWITGILAFCLSPVADNLTTALVLGAVVMAVGGTNRKFVALACINVVCAANAGGAFSPFGDITTLMVWQAGKLSFFAFFALFVPSLACFAVPALVMSFFVPKEHPARGMEQVVHIKRGGKFIIALGLSTIAMAVGFEQAFGLPPFIGMMLGLSLLMITAYFVRKIGHGRDDKFDILELVAASEWDTLLFFFGVIFSVGGLTFLGYMGLMSTTLYEGWGPSATNIFLGLISAVVDNIPVMFAVLSMGPDMDAHQWLLITLTTGVGGSLLSIGSAAGVALMGVARGQYTFFSHLKWTPVIALGYAAGIGTHFMLNGAG